jgi:hypothetical protein
VSAGRRGRRFRPRNRRACARARYSDAAASATRSEARQHPGRREAHCPPAGDRCAGFCRLPSRLTVSRRHGARTRPGRALPRGVSRRWNFHAGVKLSRSVCPRTHERHGRGVSASDTDGVPQRMVPTKGLSPSLESAPFTPAQGRPRVKPKPTQPLAVNSHAGVAVLALAAPPLWGQGHDPPAACVCGFWPQSW